MGVPGASRFLGAATLANQQGRSAQSPTVLDQSASGVLDAGRRVSVSGGGISPRARQLNQSFLNRATEINALLSLTVGPNATPEGAAQQILALRSTLDDSQLARDLRNDGSELQAVANEIVANRELPPADPAFADDVSLGSDDGGVSSSSTGQAVDTTA